MTLILTVNGPDTMWALADRRLTSNGRVVKDDATKIMFLETTDGQSILLYAGLGATARGTEPAHWMSAVLRGRNLPLEQSIGVLTDSMKAQFPRHLAALQGPGPPGHSLLATAYVDGEHRLYTVDLVQGETPATWYFRYNRQGKRFEPSGRVVPQRLSIAGSGGAFLASDPRWVHDLLPLIRAHRRRQISADAVADRLARLNHQVHCGLSDGSVGPRCIVAWRNTKDGPIRGGGDQAYYSSGVREPDSPPLPTIARGLDVKAISDALMPTLFQALMNGMATEGPIVIDEASLNKTLSTLPEGPDERLH